LTWSAAVASACAQVWDRPQLPYQSNSALPEAARLHGAPVLAKNVREVAPGLMGKTILVEGFLVDFCDGDVDSACPKGKGPFVIFSDAALAAPPGPRWQPCPGAGVLHGGVLIVGDLPPEFGGPAKQRAVIQGTLSDQSVIVPIPMDRKRAAPTETIEFDLVLKSVKALALYESACD